MRRPTIEPMEIRLTVVDAPAGEAVDLQVSAAPGSTLADLLATLPAATATAWYADRSPADRSAAGRHQPVDPRAVLGEPPLLDGVGLVNEPPPAPGTAAVRPGLLELHVIEGPDCGHVVRMPSGGQLEVGRSPGADLQLLDPGLSRLHCALTVEHHGVLLADLGSSNGTFVDGERVTDRVSLACGQRLGIGSSTLVLRTPRRTPAAVRPDHRGHLLINRGPRRPVAVPAVQLRLPSPPTTRERPRLPVLAVLLPLVLSITLATVLSMPMLLLFGLMSPVMLLGSYLSDRRSGKIGTARQQAEYQEAAARVRERARAALRTEVSLRRRALPDLAEVGSQLDLAAGAPTSRLWERRPDQPDFGELRLGTGTVTSGVTVLDPAEEYPEAIRAEEAPVAITLADVGVLGVAGPRSPVVSLVHGLLRQLVVWHSPRDLELVVLTTDEERLAELEWLCWTPHTRQAATGCRNSVGVLQSDTDQVGRRIAEQLTLLHQRQGTDRHARGPGWQGPSVVVLLDGARALRTLPGVSELLTHGPAVGIQTICLDAGLEQLPGESGATVHLQQDGRGVLCRGAAETDALPFRADLLRGTWHIRLGHALAPLRDATPGEESSAPPEAARLLEVVAPDATDPHDVGRAWARDGRSTECVIGVDAAGPCTVDLRRHGPHGLIGGTTGSGKSELLQTIIASLALGNRPDEMVFVLVDYKGGAAFKDCALLPHTVGLVTDLDGHLTRRALDSLGAELTRREHLLDAAGAKDLEDYQRSAPAAAARLPRLVVVIDEFKMLAEELPEFVDGLVRIAALGRSLGVHLLLATQRPGGIVSADIKANVNLRIALRVRDESDSQDVLEVADAARIPERCPGRAIMRSGSEPVTSFQSARVGGRATADEHAGVWTARLSPATLGDPPPPTAAREGAGPTDLARVVEATRQAAAQHGIPVPASPWLPPLDDVVVLDEPAAVEETTEPGGDWAIPYGMVDLPSEQAQRPLRWDLAHDGHLGIAGASRSGRTTALRTIAASVAGRLSAADAHLYCFDMSGSLRGLAQLPHTGAVVAHDETSRGDRLLQRLQEEVTRRQHLWGQQGFGSLSEQRSHAAAPAPRTEPTDDEGPLPYLILFVDGWQTLADAYEQVDHGRPVQTLMQILRDGAGVGLRAVLTGDRSVLMSRVAPLTTDKICLRMTDDSDLLMAGLSRQQIPEHMPGGRGLRLADGAEVQLALLTQEHTGSAQAAALRRTAERARARDDGIAACRVPFRLGALPRSIALTEITASDPGAGSAGITLGVGGDDLDPAAVDAYPDAGLTFLVAGPPGSGRSTALCTLTVGLVGSGRPVLVVADDRSATRQVAGAGGVLDVVGPEEHDRLAARLADHPHATVVVDDCERLLDSRTEDLLLPRVRAGRAGGPGGVVAAGSTHELLGMFRGLGPELAKARSGLLLTPAAAADGELVGIRAPRCDTPVPGRGVLVQRGRSVEIQVARP